MPTDVMAYSVQVRRLSEDDGGGWLAEIADLPGCMSDGDTAQEAVANVYRAADDWIDAATDLGREIPAPANDEFSGQWRIRMTKSLHRRLALLAKREGVSLNALATTLLAEAAGERRPPLKPPS